MRASFNVLDQGWIPVVRQGEREELLGIRETLARAHELRELSSASPLEEYGLYRFLGLFLMDALRPESTEEIENLLKAGKFDQEAIEQYISLCRGEGVTFDLFDEERPFLQSKYDPAVDGEAKPAAVLDFTRASGNNHTHFDHTANKEEGISPDKAARLLLTIPLFCRHLAQEYPSGVNGSPPYFSVIRGKNLFETLVFTLLPLDNIGIPFEAPPVLWRRTTPIISKLEVGKTSWLHGMLFPTRRVHVVPDEKGNVVAVHLRQGENFVNKASWRDPYVTSRKVKDGFFPMRPSADRAIWRNLSDIVNIPGGQASQLLSQYRNIHLSDVVNLTLYGVETSNDKGYINIYRHDLSFPLSLTEKSSTVDALKLCILTAETLANALRKALSEVEEIPASTVTTSVQRYYRDCEGRFWQFCEQAASENPGMEALSAYCDNAAAYAGRAFSTAVETLNLRATALAAAEKQRGRLYISIYKLKKELHL